MTSLLQPQFAPEQGAAEPWRILAPDGTTADRWQPTLSDETVLEALRLMMLSRAFDEKGFSLQRQGRFGTLSPVRGQEASVVGSAIALDPDRDWVVPQYRELPALLRQGFPLERFVLYFLGRPEGAYVPPGVNVLPLQIALAAQLPQAVGLAWGLRLQGRDSVVMVYLGEGASSEGDFHEACNLAGVMKAPVIFLLQNNGWAISTPRSKQTAGASFAVRAMTYGFPGTVVDGNDLFAVHAATGQAVQRARAGDGPSLIESVTYRMGPHNTADDPRRYRDKAEVAAWEPLDPITRVHTYLQQRGAWDAETEARMSAGIKEQIDEALATARAFPALDSGQLFEHVYAKTPPRLTRQREDLSDSGGEPVL